MCWLTEFTDQSPVNSVNKQSGRKEYKGKKVIAGYNNQPVWGNKDGQNWVPDSVDENSQLAMFYGDIQQTIFWSYSGEETVKGIKLMKFQLSDDTFKTATDFPLRANYSTTIYGLVNITGIKSVRTFITRPQMSNVVDESVLSTFTGRDISQRDYLDEFYIAIHQRSGITMKTVGRFQVSFAFNDMKRFWNVSGGYAPITWQDNWIEIEDDDADTLKSGLKTLKVGTLVPLALGIPLGAILIVAGVVLLFVHKKKFGGESRELPMKTLEIDDEGRPKK